MKIEQRKEYVPIVITLETKAEANTMSTMIERIVNSNKPAPIEKDLAIKISNWFGGHARL